MFLVVVLVGLTHQQLIATDGSIKVNLFKNSEFVLLPNSIDVNPDNGDILFGGQTMDAMGSFVGMASAATAHDPNQFKWFFNF